MALLGVEVASPGLHKYWERREVPGGVELLPELDGPGHPLFLWWSWGSGGLWMTMMLALRSRENGRCHVRVMIGTIMAERTRGDGSNGQWRWDRREEMEPE